MSSCHFESTGKRCPCGARIRRCLYRSRCRLLGVQILARCLAYIDHSREKRGIYLRIISKTLAASRPSIFHRGPSDYARSTDGMRYFGNVKDIKWLRFLKGRGARTPQEAATPPPKITARPAGAYRSPPFVKHNASSTLPNA